MSGTGLIMGEVINYLKQLEEENKKLSRDYEHYKTMTKKSAEAIQKLRDEKYQMEEENKKLKIPDGVVRAFKGLVVNWWEDEEKYYRENFDMKEKYDDDPGNIPTKYLNDCNYTDLRILDDWINEGKYEKYEIEESSSEEEEESSSEEEEEYTIEINVVGLGFCQFVDEEDRDKHVVYCKNGLWKMKGDKTAKDCEGNYCETDDEE